jgi:DNA-binding transcriptional LysR family regulator
VVATVDAGTMTAAAGQLNVAQPALSRAIKALERELQIQIFEPAGRGVRLTAAGEDVVRAARAVLAGVDEVGSVARSHARRAEPLAVVTTPTLEPLFARHFLPEYYARHAAATVRIQRAAGRDEVEASEPVMR